MGALNLTQFGGALPLWNPVLLPDGQAAACKNGYMLTGAAEGWITPTKLRSLQNGASKFAYRIPVITQAQALSYGILISQPNNGDSVTVGEYVYNFVTALAGVYLNEVLIGATLTATAQNLVSALTFDYGLGTNAGVTYSQGTTANPDVDSTSPSADPPDALPNQTISGTVTLTGGIAGVYLYVQVASIDVGNAYNNVVVSASAPSRFFWSSVQKPTSFATPAGTLLGGANPSFNSAITANSTWLEFLDPDTNVLKSEVTDDQFNRFYFASPSLPPSYNTYDRIVAGEPAWLLGVPAPGCAPGVSVSGGGAYSTLGAVNASTYSANAYSHTVYLYPVIPTGTMLLSSLAIDPAFTQAGRVNFAGIIYADASQISSVTPTYPGELLNTGTIISSFTSGNQATSVFTNPTTVFANQVYWIGFIIDRTESLFIPTTNTNQTYSFPATFSVGPPATAPVPGASGVNQNIPDFVIIGNFEQSSVLEGRAYVYTWVTAYGEEGPPSPFTLVNGYSNGTWTISLFAPQPADTGVDRNITNVNIYRTIPDTAGNTVYFFVATVPVGTETYVDNQPDNTVALNIQLPSTNWFGPPEDIQGLTALPNGMMAGFRGNEIWFCQPYLPHAWPIGYMLTTDFPIVGMGVTLGALVVLTSAYPYVIQGASPTALSQTRCSMPNPCTSRGSIVSTDNGVFYHSENGLIVIQNTGLSTNLTDNWIGRDNWQRLTPQEYLRAVPLIGQYLAFGSTSPPNVSPVDDSVAQEGFSLQLSPDASSFSIWPQPGGHRVGFTEMGAPNGVNVDNFFLDPWTGVALVIQNGAVYQFDFSDANPEPTRMIIDWTSKTYHAASRRNYAAAKVFFTVPPGTAKQTPVPFTAPPNDGRWQVLVQNNPGVYGVLFTYANDELVDAREIRGSGEILRLPSGFKAEFWQWRLVTRCTVNGIQVATSTKELGLI